MDAGLHKTSTSSAFGVLSKANGATKAGQRPKGDVQDKVYAELRRLADDRAFFFLANRSRCAILAHELRGQPDAGSGCATPSHC